MNLQRKLGLTMVLYLTYPYSISPIGEISIRVRERFSSLLVSMRLNGHYKCMSSGMGQLEDATSAVFLWESN